MDAGRWQARGSEFWEPKFLLQTDDSKSLAGNTGVHIHTAEKTVQKQVEGVSEIKSRSGPRVDININPKAKIQEAGKRSREGR